jgi:hypothetical protein
MCRERYKGPLMVVAEAPGGARKLTRAMPLLVEFPVCEVPPHTADSSYPSLGWQSKAARMAVVRLAAAGPWFQVRTRTRVAGRPSYHKFQVVHNGCVRAAARPLVPGVCHATLAGRRHGGQAVQKGACA